MRHASPFPGLVSLFAFVVLLLLAPGSARAQTFVATGAMRVPRYGQTAVLLRDGDVLLAGGSNGTALLHSAEIYDPRSGSFHLTGDLQTARMDAAGVLLPDGDALIAGGLDALGQPLRSAEVYEPKEGVFHAAGDLIDPLQGIVAYRLHDGMVILFGMARCSATIPVCTDSVEKYEPATRSFSAAGDLPFGSGDFGFATTLLHNGELLVVGGGLPVGASATNEAELYFPSNDSARFTASRSPFDSFNGHLVTLRNGDALLAGGNNFAGMPKVTELYDPATDSFTQGKPLTVPFPQNLTLLKDGDVLLSSEGLAGNDAELYIPSRGDFQPIAPMLSGRNQNTATRLKDGRVLIAGGEDPSQSTFGNVKLATVSAELFVPFHFELDSGVTEKWLPHGRDWIAFTVYPRGQAADGTRVQLSCSAGHADCDAYPQNPALGGKSYVIVHGLRRLDERKITVWVKGTADGETCVLRLTIVVPQAR